MYSTLRAAMHFLIICSATRFFPWSLFHPSHQIPTYRGVQGEPQPVENQRTLSCPYDGRRCIVESLSSFQPAFSPRSARTTCRLRSAKSYCVVCVRVSLALLSECNSSAHKSASLSHTHIHAPCTRFHAEKGGGNRHCLLYFLASCVYKLLHTARSIPNLPLMYASLSVHQCACVFGSACASVTYHLLTIGLKRRMKHFFILSSLMTLMFQWRYAKPKTCQLVSGP